MKYVIGIDGGGTKTRYTLSTHDLEIIEDFTDSTIHYQQIGFEQVTIRLNKNIAKLIAKVDDVNLITHVFVALPGYGDIKNDTANLEAAVKNGLGNLSYTIGNDTENALSGSLNGSYGINVIAGTGSIGLGITRDGRRYTSGGWCHDFGGDEGSAYWLACRMLLEYTQQSDNRKPKTLLYTYLNDELQLEDDTDILDLTLNKYKMDRTKIASLSVHLSALASLNDSAALAIFKEAAYELSKIYFAIFNELKFDTSVPISYSGGVFKSGKFILEPLKSTLAENNLTLSDPVHDPSVGGLLLAIKASK